MNARPECPEAMWVERHFLCRGDAVQERQMRAHLVECPECRQHYNRWLLVSRLDPKAAPAKERIARGLGLAARPNRPWRAWARVAFPVAAAAAFCLFAMRPASIGTFQARGHVGMDASSQVVVYRLPPDRSAEPILGSMSPLDEIALAYRNPHGFRRWMAWAVDEHRHVYWYVPAWTSEEEIPVAVEAEPGDALHEYPDGVRHNIDGRQLRFYVLFTNQVVSVRDVEHVISQGGGKDDLERWGSVTQIEMKVQP